MTYLILHLFNYICMTDRRFYMKIEEHFIYLCLFKYFFHMLYQDILGLFDTLRYDLFQLHAVVKRPPHFSMIPLWHLLCSLKIIHFHIFRHHSCFSSCHSSSMYYVLFWTCFNVSLWLWLFKIPPVWLFSTYNCIIDLKCSAFAFNILNIFWHAIL